MGGQADTRTDNTADRAGAHSDEGRAPALISTGEAARLAGVNARTIRRWIERGYLPSETGGNGALVSPSDLPAAKAAADRAAGGGRPANMDPGTRPDARPHQDARPPGHPSDTLPAPSHNARDQLEAIRDEWLAPLVAQISEQAETIGGLRAERDALRSRLSALEAHQAESPDEPTSAPETRPRRAWWQFWEPRGDE